MAAPAHQARCGICGAAAPGGGTLCRECVAAVKRARHVGAVAPRILPLPAGAAAAEPAAGAALRSGGSDRWRRLPGLPRGWGPVVAFAIFAAAVLVTGYMAVQELANNPHLPDGAPTVAGSADLAPTGREPATRAAASHPMAASEGSRADGSREPPKGDSPRQP